MRSMGAQAAGRLKTHDTLPDEATGTLRLWIIAAGSLAALILYAAITPKNPIRSVGRLIAPLADIAPARRVSITDVIRRATPTPRRAAASMYRPASKDCACRRKSRLQVETGIDRDFRIGT